MRQDERFIRRPREVWILAQTLSDYDRLIRPVEDQMVGSIWRILPNGDDADDALQDALVTILRRLPRIRCHPNPHALILKICADAAYDLLRRKLRRRSQEGATCELDAVAEATSSPPEQLADRERDKEIASAIARLSRNQATAVVMRLIQRQTYRDIAAALGCQETTARIHVTRGRRRLSSLLAHLAPFSFREAKS